jgi:broad specificity phosphatase PhoE
MSAVERQRRMPFPIRMGAVSYSMWTRIEKFIEPSLQQYRGQAPTRHLVMVAHGIFNAELLGALLARRTDDRAAWEYRGEQRIPACWECYVDGVI